MSTPTVTLPVVVAPAQAVNSQTTGFVEFTIFGAHMSVNPMFIVLLLGLFLFGYMLWQGQRESGENTFDVWDLLMDTLPSPVDPTKTVRRASGIKVSFQTCFFVSTWVIVDRELKGTLDAALFGVYTGAWAISLIAKVIFDQKQMPSLKLKEE